MKVLAFCAATAALLLPSTSFAAPLSCSSGSLASYLGLVEGCSIGSSIFSGFETFAVPGVTDIDPADVTVTPVSGLSNPGFLFSGPFQAGPDVLLGLGVIYNAQGLFAGNQAELTNPVVTLDAAITLIEDKCIGGIFASGFCGGIPDNITLVATEFFSETTGSISFQTTTLLGIRNELVIDGGLDGTASLGSFRNQLTAVPEPGTFLLLSLGMMTLVAYRPKTHPKKSKKVRKLLGRNI